MANASETLVKLQSDRDRATGRVDAIEREARAAGVAAAQASAALVELERHGGSASKRHALEEALTTARAKAGEPWAERIAGARSAVRDADRAVHQFTVENLTELVADMEADGRVATERLNAACADLIAAYTEREAVASRISAVASTVRRVRPGDVTFSRAEAVAREADRLIGTGGEAPPHLRRDPRLPRHGEVAAATEPVPA